MVAHNGSADSATTPAMRALLRRLELSTGGVIRFETDAARFDPDAAGAPELAAFNTALMLARRFDRRLALAAQSRGARRAHHAARRRDGARGRSGNPHARGARSGARGSQSRDARIEQRGARRIYRAGRIGRGRDARGRRRSHISRVGDSNHRRVRGAGRRRRFHSAVARDARVLERHWTARRARRTGSPRKPRAASGRRLVGDRMRAAASRARAASAGRPAAQSRRPRSALPEIQMDLRPMLSERARAMAREDGPPRAGGGRRAPVLRRARALERHRRAGPSRRRATGIPLDRAERAHRAMRPGRLDRARNDPAMRQLRLSARAHRRPRRTSTM